MLQEGTAFFPNSSLAGNGLLVSDGAIWRRQRQLSNPAFRTAAVKAYAQVALCCCMLTSSSFLICPKRAQLKSMPILYVACVCRFRAWQHTMHVICCKDVHTPHRSAQSKCTC